jgi:hypothetical protein
MSRILFGAMAVVCFGGCLPFVPVPYAFPTASCTPPVFVEAPDETHVFRVDVRRNFSGVEFNSGDTYALTELGTYPGGWILPQAQVYADYGFVWNCIALIYTGHIHHTHQVRLYRPGYKLVEIQAWQLGASAKWINASDTAQQEKAIDELLATPGWRQDMLKPAIPELAKEERQKHGRPWGFEQLAPGSHFAAHRKALIFAACEYERLAGATDVDVPARERLLAKATWLRELAARH